MAVRIRAKMAERKKLAWPLLPIQPLPAVDRAVANDGGAQGRGRLLARTARGPEVGRRVLRVRRTNGVGPPARHAPPILPVTISRKKARIGQNIPALSPAGCVACRRSFALWASARGEQERGRSG